MDAEELEKKFGVTRKQLDEWSEPFENGKWPEGKTVHLGRPRLDSGEVKPVTFKIPVTEIEAIDDLAKRTGRTRSQVLRDGVRHELSEA